MLNIAVFGPPGAGKGTQSKLICDKLGFTHISMGDLIRSEIKLGTNLGKEINSVISKGDLVSDNFIMSLLAKNYTKIRTKGIILDGFPRTVIQAKDLKILLDSYNSSLDLVIALSVDEDTVYKRILGRYLCNSCGCIYNKFLSPSKKEGFCDFCDSSDMIMRTDDNREVIKNRITNYNLSTAPTLKYLKGISKVVEIDGNCNTDRVFNKILDKLEPLTKN